MTGFPGMPAVIRDYVDAFNAGDFPKLLGLFTPDAVVFGVLGSAPIPQAEPIWRELHEGMVMRLNPQSVGVDGATVAVRYLETGRFEGTFRGLPGSTPTGLTYQVIAIEWFEWPENGSQSGGARVTSTPPRTRCFAAAKPAASAEDRPT